ncbi:MAG: hypothetical protein U0401_22035 [Anaerolineae bacterium]
MSQAAPPSLTMVLQRGGGVYQLVLASGLIRLILLLVASAGLTLWLASGQANADFLFQSPASPVSPPEVDPTQPQLQPLVEPPPGQQQPVGQPPVVDPNAPPPVQSSPGLAAPTPARPVKPSRRNQDDQPVEETNAGPANFILDQAELIDTIVVTGAWVWLCCGILLILIVPLFFVVVYIRGRRKIIDQEGYR